jgi:hypothetical protein
MKAWINISAVIFAAGMLTALADEPKTNAPAGATSSVPASASPDAVPPTTTATSAPAPAVVHKVKPAAVVPLTPTSAVPARSNITATPLTTTNVNTPPPMPPSTSAPAITDETRTPEEESMMPTNAVPAQTNVTAAPPPESSGSGRKLVLAIGVALLAVVGGLTVFLLRRSGSADHASLITRAMSENKEEDKHEDRHEEPHEEKKDTRKLPPPMN